MTISEERTKANTCNTIFHHIVG